LELFQPSTSGALAGAEDLATIVAEQALADAQRASAERLEQLRRSPDYLLLRAARRLARLRTTLARRREQALLPIVLEKAPIPAARAKPRRRRRGSIWEQLTIFFVPGPPRQAVTPLMAALERAITKLCAVGEPIPNNPGLGELIGNRGRSSVDRALRGLAALGRIRIELNGRMRRVWVSAAGQFTGWGVIRKGHAPFSSRARGSPRPQRPIVERLGAPQTQPIHFGVLRECQWPVAEQGRTLVMCCAPVVKLGKPYCETHHLRACG